MRIVIKSEIMENDWGEDFLKSIQGSITVDEWTFVGIGANGFIMQYVSCEPSLVMDFEFEKLKVDWRCISGTPIPYYPDEWWAFDGYETETLPYTISSHDAVNKNSDDMILDFRWLNNQKGIEVI